MGYCHSVLTSSQFSFLFLCVWCFKHICASSRKCSESWAQHAFFFFFIFFSGCARWHVGSWSSTQESDPPLPHCGSRVWTTGPPGQSSRVHFEVFFRVLENILKMSLATVWNNNCLVIYGALDTFGIQTLAKDPRGEGMVINKAKKPWLIWVGALLYSVF